MLRFQLSRLAILFLTLIALLVPLSALAQSGVADPGFVYVDVNNDGRYSAADGDIGKGATGTGPDIKALIVNNGAFDTSKSEGAYHAPCRPASLVVPASQSIASSFSLKLKAGVNIIVHGSLQSGSICLTACSNIDMTDSSSVFDTTFTARAGCNVTLDGTGIAGTQSGSTLHVDADNNIYGRPAADGKTTALFANTKINLCADCTVCLDTAAITIIEDAGGISVEGSGDVRVVGSSLGFTGNVLVESKCGSVVLNPTATSPSSSITSSAIKVNANCDADVTGSAFLASSTIDINANGALKGGGSQVSFIGGTVKLAGSALVDMTGASLVAQTGAITIRSCNGCVTLSGVHATAVNGFKAQASGRMTADHLSVVADHLVRLMSDCDSVTAAYSTVNPNDVMIVDTKIQAQAQGSVDVSNVTWNAPEEISLVSRCGNVTAVSAWLHATEALGVLSFKAGGGTVDLTNASLLGNRDFDSDVTNIVNQPAP